MNRRSVMGRVFVFTCIIAFCGCPFRDDGRDYRGDMRAFVQDISAYAKGIAPGFIVVPQNGLDLLTTDDDPAGPLATTYVAALDGVAQEHVYYGQDDYDVPTNAGDRDFYIAFLDLAEGLGLDALVTDYCSTHARVDDSYAANAARGYIGFAAYGSDYDLDNIPPYPPAPYGENADDVNTLADAKNFLYLINPEPFASRAAFVAAVSSTNYDALIMDPFYSANEPFTAADVAALQQKANGGRRLVLAYVNIGAAEEWRYYWEPGWRTGNPSFIAGLYQGWPGEYWVRYWETGWRDIIFGNDASHIKRVLDAGFDGVYLDNILAFEYFE